MEENYDYLVKIAIIGDACVGKTNILKRFVFGSFDIVTSPTIGVDFYNSVLKIDDSTIKTQLWDTAGQERYRSVTSIYYKNTSGIALVYDITDVKSFNSIPFWLQDINKHAINKPKLLLIGNKKDKENERQVGYYTGRDFAEANGMIFFETSALDNTNISTAFKILINEIYENLKIIEAKKVPQRTYLKNKTTKPSTRKCC